MPPSLVVLTNLSDVSCIDVTLVPDVAPASAAAAAAAARSGWLGESPGASGPLGLLASLPVYQLESERKLVGALPLC